MSSKDDKLNLEKGLDIFDKHRKDIKEYSYYKKMYQKIKEYYLNKVEDNEEFIYIERARLQCKTGQNSTTQKTVYFNILVLACSFLLNCITLALSVSSFGNDSKYYIIFAFAFLFYGFMLYSIFGDFDPNANDIYYLALQVLDDIEQEMSKNKVDRFEDQQRVFASMEEIAAALEGANRRKSILTKIKRKLM